MNVDFADEEMIAYRESLIEKKKEQPFWKKKCLSVMKQPFIQVIGRGKYGEVDEKERLQFYDDRRLSGVCHHR